MYVYIVHWLQISSSLLIQYYLSPKHLKGFLCYLIAALLSILKLSSENRQSLLFSLKVAAYGNSCAAILGAMYNVRGLIPSKWEVQAIPNMVSGMGFALGVPAVMNAIRLVIKGTTY